jgi:drug/metabolite transporter (DMT)-like permease
LRTAKGPLLTLVAAAFFGGATAAAKALLGEVTPFMLAGLLYLGSGLGLGAYVLARRSFRTSNRHSTPLTRSDLPWLSSAVLCGGILAPLLLMWGLLRTPASTTSLLLNLEGVLTALIAWMVFRENIGPRVLLGLLAIIAGAVFLSISPAGGADGGILGRIAIVVACLAWALDNNFTRRISALDPAVIAGIKGLVAGGVNVSIALAMGQAIPRASLTALSCLVGFIGYGASLVLFVLALRAMGAARTGALFSTAPFIGAIASLLFLGEHASAMLLPAAILMGAGVWIQLGEKHRHEHVHEVLVHQHQHEHDEHHLHEHAGTERGETRHNHPHSHVPGTHIHQHFPDIHHRHRHK